MTSEFSAELWYWRGPAPFYFVTVPADECSQLKELSGQASYGWGMIPATARIGATEWTTALFPKDGRYLIPVKERVRNAEDLADGDVVSVTPTIDP